MSTKIDDWEMTGSAIFSVDRLYRYVLRRAFVPFDQEDDKVVFIMLNPSTADEQIADPTVRRCMTYARDWGYTRMRVLNLFALRSTDPKLLYKSLDPIGRDNDFHTFHTISATMRGNKPLVVCAWGEHGKYLDRDKRVLAILREREIEPQCLRVNASGQPAHPLYLPKDLTPIPYVI